MYIVNILLLILALSLLFCCTSIAQKKQTSSKNKTYNIVKTEEEWKSTLTEKEYYVLRLAGTERAFTSPLNKNYEQGTYHCKACNIPLFESDHKFDSGSGWPSFDRAIEGNVAYSTDYKIGYSRQEEHCANCGGHLGHVFNDGPKDTTGKRHCINGVSLKFIPRRKKEK